MRLGSAVLTTGILLAASPQAAESAAQSTARLTGVVRCVIAISGDGYVHHETQQWSLLGPPLTQSGLTAVYPADWTTSGQGSYVFKKGDEQQTAAWTVDARGNPQVGVTRAKDDTLAIKQWGPPLKVKNGVTGVEQVTRNGKAHGRRQGRADALEISFSTIETSGRSTQIVGTTSFPSGDGPEQPPSATGRVACEWNLKLQ